MIEQPTRRGFLRALGFVAAAPAIIKVSALMPVQAMPLAGGCRMGRAGLVLLRTDENLNTWGDHLNENFTEALAEHKASVADRRRRLPTR